jgi:capsule biosynthesis phosphatase
MIHKDKCIVFDVDGTICAIKKSDEDYIDVLPNADVVQRLREYREEGFYIILATARNMNTYNGNVGLIGAKTAKTLLSWLDKHNIPYDELHVGKPWAGKGGFYVDDKAIRPDEFVKLSYEQVLDVISKD